jgi:hypothetical protein
VDGRIDPDAFLTLLRLHRTPVLLQSSLAAITSATPHAFLHYVVLAGPSAPCHAAEQLSAQPQCQQRSLL